MSPPSSPEETTEIRARYARRAAVPTDRYSAFAPDVILRSQARERALIRLLLKQAALPVGERSVLEVGCGEGINLLQLIRLGFDPAKMVGNELREESLVAARAILPASVRLVAGEASTAEVGDAFDIVTQSTMFSSILDPTLRQAVARRMWALTKPGGAVLWYDLAYDNPRNPDVHGVALPAVRALFPEGRMTVQRVTLAPPIARVAAALHPVLYTAFDLIPLLRSHLLCWIEKP